MSLRLASQVLRKRTIAAQLVPHFSTPWMARSLHCSSVRCDLATFLRQTMGVKKSFQPQASHNVTPTPPPPPSDSDLNNSIDSFRRKRKVNGNVGRAEANLRKNNFRRSREYKNNSSNRPKSNDQKFPFEQVAIDTLSHPSFTQKVKLSKDILAMTATLEDQVNLLNSKTLDLAERIRSLSPNDAVKNSEFETGWGSDKLAPPLPDASSSAKTPVNDVSLDKAPPPPNFNSKKVTTQLLHGESLVAESKLRLRDEKGAIKSDLTSPIFYPQTDGESKWKNSVSGSLSGSDVNVETVEPLRKMQVSSLAHGLDRVLFNPGVHWLRDPRSGIYNFDPHLRDVLDVDLFDYSALTPYITSSKDQELGKLTKLHQKKYCGSTSSMTTLLSQCYFHISGWKDPDVSGFSAPFQAMPQGYSAGSRIPASIVLHYKDGYYAIDADKGEDEGGDNNNYVLTSLGKSMEMMLTLTPEQYAKYMRVNSWKLTQEERNKPEAYHYAKTSKMMMRSQLDCQDDRLPGKTFDLKTRASVSIRNDRANYVEGSGYQIRRATGLLESFEREYFDMVRAAFLKYNFQVRIGHMDGIFVAYHTTSSIFGFQYISVQEMNERLFGSEEMGDQAFKLSLGMMEAVLDAATNMFPKQTLKITIESREKGDVPMSVFVEPVEATETSASQDPCSITTTAAAVETPETEPSQEETATIDSNQAPKRTIAQLDVTVDRYLDGGLVRGPIDFTALPGRHVDPMMDDEIERRMRRKLPPVRWEIDYSISPRPKLTEDQIRNHLEDVRKRQNSFSALLLPNVDALNEREKYRETELAKNPKALERFLLERANGIAPGMPLAPGQLSAFQLAAQNPTLVTLNNNDPSSSTETNSSSSSTTNDDDDDETVPILAGSENSTPPPPPTPTTPTTTTTTKKSWNDIKWSRIRSAQAIRLRQLAKLGAQDAKQNSLTDPLIMYQSPTSS